MVGCWREPYVNVQPDLMAGMTSKHRTTTRLGHVAYENSVPTDALGALSEPFDENHKAWVAPVSVARDAHDLPARAGDRKLDRAGQTAVAVSANRPRDPGRRGRFSGEQLFSQHLWRVRIGKWRQRRRV